MLLEDVELMFIVLFLEVKKDVGRLFVLNGKVCVGVLV